VTLGRFAARALAAAVILGGGWTTAKGQTIDPFFAGQYSLIDLGPAPSVPASFGGATFKPGDANTLLLGGAANRPGAQIFEVGVTRDNRGHIDGFTGTTSVFADAPGTAGGGIDGGLSVGPDDVLFYTTFQDNSIGQIKPGSSGPDRLIDLTPLGVAPSTGSLSFVPDGFPGAGRLKISSFDGDLWYDASVSPDGTGTFDISNVSAGIPIGDSPEGIAYVPLGSPLFDSPSVLTVNFFPGTIGTFEVDANGDPIVATRRDFITGLAGAEGAAVDPLTGDFVFSTFNNRSRVAIVRGFVPEPASISLLAFGIIALSRRRRER